MSKQDCFAKLALTLVLGVGFAGFCVLTLVERGSRVTPKVVLMAVDRDRLILEVRSQYLKFLERNQDFKQGFERNKNYLSVWRELQPELLVSLLFPVAVVGRALASYIFSLEWYSDCCASYVSPELV